MDFHVFLAEKVYFLSLQTSRFLSTFVLERSSYEDRCEK